MRYLLIIIVLLFQVTIAAATISGKVVDSGGRPVAGIVVGIEDLYYTGKTAGDGTFRFDNLEPGDYILHLSDGTWGHYTYDIRVKKNFYLKIAIDRKKNESNPLVSVRQNSLRDSQQSITYEEIVQYPMRGAGDSLHLLQTLPGVGGGFSLATVPIIRSTNPLLTKYYIDGIPINNPYHFVGAFLPVMSAINEEVIDEAVLYKGDAPIWMGDNTGHVVDIKTKEPSTTGFHGKILFDTFLPLLPTIAVTGVPDPYWSFSGALRRSTADILLDVEENNYNLADFYFKTRYIVNNDHRLTFIANGSSESFRWDDFVSESGYNLFALQWDYRIKRNLLLNTSMSRYQLDRKLENQDSGGAKVTFDPVEYRLFQSIWAGLGVLSASAGYEYTRYMNGATSNVGMDALASTDALSVKSEAPTTEYKIEGDGIMGFIDTEVNLKSAWIELGGKYEYFGVQETNNYAYRGEVGYYIDKKTAFYVNAGRYITHPDMLYYLGAVNVTPAGDEMTTPAKLKDTVSHNFALGSKSYYFPDALLQAEVFYMMFDDMYPGGNLVTVKDDAMRKAAQLHKFALEDDGYNLGVELSYAQKFLRRYHASFAYTYQTTSRNGSNDSKIVKLLGQDKKDIDSEFSQTHIIRATGRARFGKFVPSLIFHAYSSLPYTIKEGTTETELGGTQTIFAKENDARYSLHHRLDGKVNYFMSDTTRLYVEVWNMYFNSTNEVADNDNNSSDMYADIPIFIWIGMELCF